MFFFNWGQWGAKVLVEFENVILIVGIFFKLGAMGSNVLVEFENVFFNWGAFFYNWGPFFKLGGNGGKWFN